MDSRVCPWAVPPLSCDILWWPQNWRKHLRVMCSSPVPAMERVSWLLSGSGSMLCPQMKQRMFRLLAV